MGGYLFINIAPGVTGDRKVVVIFLNIEQKNDECKRLLYFIIQYSGVHRFCGFFDVLNRVYT